MDDTNETKASALFQPCYPNHRHAMNAFATEILINPGGDELPGVKNARLKATHDEKDFRAVTTNVLPNDAKTRGQACACGAKSAKSTNNENSESKETSDSSSIVDKCRKVSTSSFLTAHSHSSRITRVVKLAFPTKLWFADPTQHRKYVAITMCHYPYSDVDPVKYLGYMRLWLPVHWNQLQATKKITLTRCCLLLTLSTGSFRAGYAGKYQLMGCHVNHVDLSLQINQQDY